LPLTSRSRPAVGRRLAAQASKLERDWAISLVVSRIDRLQSGEELNIRNTVPAIALVQAAGVLE
jgi:hypothetical protein